MNEWKKEGGKEEIKKEKTKNDVNQTLFRMQSLGGYFREARAT